MEGKIQLLSIGDATYDVFLDPTESEALCKLDDKDCLICFSYGDKIPVRHLDISLGGNAANNSVGSRRLGVTSSAVLTLGKDEIGEQIYKKLESEGVDTSFIVQQEATSSNYSVIINYSGERTIFTYNAPKSYEFPVKLPSVPWVYLTSMGDAFRPFYNHLVEWIIKTPNVKLAFNPGSRQIRAGIEAISSIVKLSYIIYINREEAEKLTGLEDSKGKEKDLLKALVTLGVEVPIVTDGANGSYAYDGNRFLKCGVLPIDAFERTGAGDAFGSGCVSALIKGKSLEEALIWGTVNSASVIGYTGSQRGLLHESEMGVWLERARSSGVGVVEF